MQNLNLNLETHYRVETHFQPKILPPIEFCHHATLDFSAKKMGIDGSPKTVNALSIRGDNVGC